MITEALGKENAWKDFAICSGMNPAVFYPPTEEEQRDVARICFSCPVQYACLEHALRHNEREGVWGGTTEKQRRKLSRNMRRDDTPISKAVESFCYRETA